MRLLIFILPSPGVEGPLHSGDLQKYNTPLSFKLTIREAYMGEAKAMCLLKELLHFGPLVILFGNASYFEIEKFKGRNKNQIC